MAEDIEKPRGPLKRSSPTAGGANPRLTPVLGIVKDNIDPTRSGVIKVYLTDNSGLDPENRDNWRPVRMLNPFYGFTRPDAGNDGFGSYKGNPSSYGMWMSPPDIGTTVLCLFVNGDMNYGFYMGSVMEPEAMTMIPAIGATDNIVPNQGEADSYGGAPRLPVTNINTNNKAIADNPSYLDAPKPIHSYSSAIMFQQGILRDPVRGPISSTSQRETPSRVGWGVSTPGRPIYEGGFDDKSIAENLKGEKAKQLRVVSRRGGHTIVMDDGDIIGRDQLVRIRTALGHQILMSDDGQTLMILHSNGQSYIELGKEGTIDMYSTNSVNIRTQGDLNLHADNNVNINATKNLNLQGENIQFNTEKEFKGRIGTDYSVFALGKHLTKVTGAMSMESAGDISVASTAIAYINGSKVNLNSGQTSTKPVEVPAIDKVLHTDTLFDQQKGFLAAPAKLVSITTRAPAHAPWAAANQGVDVKTDLNADSQLPASPPPSVLATNSAATASLDNPVTTSSAASAPPANPVSPSMGGKVTSAIAGSLAQSATSGPLANAVTQGVAIGNTPLGTQAAVGVFPLTATQLEQGGTIKPGSAALVNALATATGNVQTSLTKNLFTGQPGAQSLPQLVGSVQGQTQALTSTLQQAQSSLQAAGAISGKETASQIGGLVTATMNNGLNNTLDTIKSVGSQAAGIANLSDKANGVLKDISKGNFAAAVGEGVNGALAGINNSVEALAKSPSLAGVIDQTKGVSASAFNAIKESLKPLQAGVPQNLTEIAKKAAEETIALSTSDITNEASQAAQSLANQATTTLGKGGLVDAVGGAVNSVTSGISSTVSSILPKTGSVADSLVGASKNLGSVAGSALSNATSSLGAVASSVETASTAFASPSSLAKGSNLADGLAKTASATATGLLQSTAGSLASGLGKLPGGAGAVSAITNLAKGSVPDIPGTADLKGAIGELSKNALNGLGNLSANTSNLLNNLNSQAGGLKSLLSAGIPAGAASQLQSALSSIAGAGSGIKIPSIALNTTDRSSITAAVTGQLGDPGIPTPNFGEISEEVKGKVASIEGDRIKYAEELSELAKELEKAEYLRDTAFNEFDNLRNNLPAGDPQIAQWQARYEIGIMAVESVEEKIKGLKQKFPNIASATPVSSTTQAG